MSRLRISPYCVGGRNFFSFSPIRVLIFFSSAFWQVSGLSFSICGSLKHNVGTEEIDKLPGNTCGSHGSKATITNHYQHSTTFGADISNCDIHIVTFGAVIRKRPKYCDNYSITLGTTNIVMHYHITFGAGISAMTTIVLQKVPYQRHSVTSNSYFCCNFELDLLANRLSILRWVSVWPYLLPEKSGMYFAFVFCF